MYCLQWLIPVLLLPKPVSTNPISTFWVVVFGLGKIYAYFNKSSVFFLSGEPGPALQPRYVRDALPCRVTLSSSHLQF
jgi:hypothetical protein